MGGRVELLSYAGDDIIYKPLRDRFFREVSTSPEGKKEIVPRWVLNLNKSRVKDILRVE